MVKEYVLRNRSLEKRSKYDWVDISKGMVICLMVIGHSSIPELVSRWIWSFHMPFFFIISALFTSWNKGTVLGFAIRKAKILIIPFVIYSVINIVGFAFIQHQNLIEYTKKIIVSGWGGVALWFVPVFYISLIVCRKTANKYLYVVALLMFSIGVILSYCSIILPWALSSIPFATFLLLIIRRCKTEVRVFFTNISFLKNCILAFIGIIISAFIGFNWPLDMAWNSILPVIPILMGIISGTAAIICMSVLIVNTRILNLIIGIPFKHIGRNTYEIMALSQITIVILNVWVNECVVLKYSLLVSVLTSAIYTRKFIEGKFANLEAI